jgi:hypothetical protein
MMQRWMHRCSSPTTFEKWFASNCTSANVKPYFHLQEISAQRGAGTASVLRFIPSADRLCQPSLNGITNADCFREADLSELIFERIAKERVSQPECHVYESDQDRNLDQRPHNSNECLARVQAEYGNRYGNSGDTIPSPAASRITLHAPDTSQPVERFQHDSSGWINPDSTQQLKLLCMGIPP